MGSIHNYLREFADATRSENASAICRLLSLDGLLTMKATASLSYQQQSRIQMPTLYEQLKSLAQDMVKTDPPYHEFIAYHLCVCVALYEGDLLEASSKQANTVTMFLRIFGANTWGMEVFHTLNSQLRTLATEADRQQVAKNLKAECREDAARVLNKSFTVTISDRGAINSASKKWGTMHVINNLFKIYFALNNLRLCKNLIRAIEGKGFPKLASYPVSQYVTYKYFVGRLHMFDGNYAEAEKALQESFDRCTVKSPKNKRLILLYLIPLKLLRGSLPRPALLRKYNLYQFLTLSDSVRCGNLSGFNNEMAAHQEFFIQKGVYLILEKLTTITYRNLFKRIYRITGSTKIPLKSFTVALQYLGMDVDQDEVECIVANLIYQGRIKGYLSHKMSVLVVSGKNAFPPL